MEKLSGVRLISTRGSQLHITDAAVLLLFVFEVPSLLFSQDRANSIPASEAVTLAVLIYFLLRLTIRTGFRSAWLSALLGVGGVWLALSGISQFLVATQQLTTVGLTDFIAFRSRFIHPIPGWVPGECFTVFLLTLFFACAAATYVWQVRLPKGNPIRLILVLLPAFPILTVLSLSLSRSVFWSTVFFFVISCLLMTAYRVITLPKASLLLAGALGMLLLILLCEIALYPGIFRAYAGGDVSQVRSTQGRIDIWERSLDLTRGHRIWGVGSSNVALSLLSSSDQEDTTGFASRTFSLPIQILTEKGFVGFALYLTFLVVSFWEFHLGMQLDLQKPAKMNSFPGNKRKLANRNNGQERDQLLRENAYRAMKCCFAAGLVSVLLRELTYSSLLEHTLTLVLFFALIASMVSTNRLGSLKMKPVVIALAIVVLALQVPYCRYALAESKLAEFYSQVLSANFAGAEGSINEAIRLWPWNARYYGWRAYITSQQLPSQCLRHSTKGPGLSEAEKRSALEAVEDYRHSLKLNRRDAVAHHNLAWLEHLLGEDASAAADWREAVKIDPDNAVFHLSYGMFLEENGTSQLAMAQYESAIELKPSIVDSPFFVRYRRRSPEGANSLVKNCTARIETRLRQSGDPILEARLGELYLYAGNFGQSAHFLEAAVRQLPNLPLVWFNLGELEEARGNLEQALVCYRRARAIDASLSGPYLRMGEIDLRSGQTQNAIYDLRMAEQRWERINPITAAHNNRLYGGPPQTIDDLLPTTLVWFISPCEASEAMSTLSQLIPQNREYAERNRTCEEIPAPHSGLE